MDLKSIFSEILTWQLAAQFILLCVNIYLLTFAIRRVVETSWPKIKYNNFWKEIFLPLGPIGNGVILSLVVSLPWETPIQGFWLKSMFGAFCGQFSGYVYNRVKKIFSAFSSGNPSTENTSSSEEKLN